MSSGTGAAGAAPPRLAHVAVAVGGLAAAEAFLGRLGLRAGPAQTLRSHGVRAAFAPVGESAIELIEPTDAGPLARFLVEHGSAVHHVAVEVADIDAAVAAARLAGLRLIDETPREGAHGTRVAFIHPRSAHGVLVELVERPRATALDP